MMPGKQHCLAGTHLNNQFVCITAEQFCHLHHRIRVLRVANLLSPKQYCFFLHWDSKLTFKGDEIVVLTPCRLQNCRQVAWKQNGLIEDLFRGYIFVVFFNLVM